MRVSSTSTRYHPQQSVLYPQAGHRQTACMRNISLPQRSQSILSSAAGWAQEGRDAASGRGVSGMGNYSYNGGMSRLFAEADYAALRAEMVERQIRARGVSHARVLAAMNAVPRHCFVLGDYCASAYDDRPLPIGEGQTISQPYMVAAMTAALDPAPDARVLEVGTGSGYQAAVLAHLAHDVITIERHPRLAARAQEILKALGLANVRVVVGDGSLGYAEAQPYAGIMVTAAAPHVPETLRAQLALGGRLVIPVGSTGFQELIVETRQAHGFNREVREGCVFVPLIGAHGYPDRGR
jgi:protein-L-isoaspartate(D-aspartate) O-methyltransferase